MIGAGMAGLVCADALRNRGADVVVFEKSRGIGGRLASREVPLPGLAEPVRFDHGAPALRPREADFADFLESLVRHGSAAPWRHALVVGMPCMRALLAPLAERLDIRPHARVDTLAQEGGRWWLDLEPHAREGGRDEGREGPFDRVVLAVPAHQARQIMRDLVSVPARIVRDELQTIETKPCWTLLAAFDGGSEPVGSSAPLAGVEWLVDESVKPGRNRSVRAWTLQMSADWTIPRLECEREDVLPEMLDTLRARTGETGEPLVAMAHRWRYSQTLRAFGEPFLEADGLVIGGDWTLGACAEDAWRSGTAMATALLA